MSAGYTLTVDDMDIRAGLDGIIALGGDLSAVMEDIGSELDHSTLQRIRVTNVAPDGTPWKPSRRAQIDGGRTLFETGAHLAETVRHEVDGTNAVEIGSSFVGAAILNGGGEITAKGGFLKFSLAGGGFAQVKSVHMPARPFLGLSDGDKVAILDIVGEHIGLATSDLFVGRA